MDEVPGLWRSPFQAMMGFRLVEWRDGWAKVVLDVRPEFLNRTGVLHGGVLATMLDCSLGYAACFSPDSERASVTISLTTGYLAPASDGMLVATGKVDGGGRKIVACTGEVRHGEGGRLLAVGQGSFKRLR